MSRLWNKLQAKVWPAARRVMGIELAGDRLVAIHAELVGEVWGITGVEEKRLAFAPFRGVPRAEDELALSQALASLADAQRQAQPIQFALPDPAALFQIWELESLPGTVQERNALARFRLEKEWPSASKMECVTQPLGVDRERALMLVIAVDRAWIECLRGACRTAGIVPTVMDMTVCHVFNQLHDKLHGQTSDGALLMMEPHAWTLLLWDQQARPRFVRTRWRETIAGRASDHDAIAVEVERLVRAYVLAAPGRIVSSLYVSAEEIDATPIAERLDTRMHTPCIRMDRGQGLSLFPDIKRDLLSPGALAAAVLRA